MEVHWTPRALKDLERIPPEPRSRISQAVTRFAETGHGDVKRLRAISPPEFRLRVGDCGVRFRPRNGLTILRVRNRRESY